MTDGEIERNIEAQGLLFIQRVGFTCACSVRLWAVDVAASELIAQQVPCKACGRHWRLYPICSWEITIEEVQDPKSKKEGKA